MEQKQNMSYAPIVFKFVSIDEKEMNNLGKYFFMFLASLFVLSIKGYKLSRLNNRHTSLSMSSSSSKVIAHDALAEVSKSGEFVRTSSGFREIISQSHPIYKPDKNRYHLYISLACPWANRCYSVLHLKGLLQGNIITVSNVHPTWMKTKPDDATDQHKGWPFMNSNLNNIDNLCDTDPIMNAMFVRDIYEKSNDTLGKYSVPLLYDKESKTIVNNESSEILRMFNSEFNQYVSQEYAGIDLYPSQLRDAIDDVNSWIYTDINNGVYRCGFATTQAAYDDAVTTLFNSVQRLEDILSKQRYLVSNDQITEADIRLFMTLVRFDEVYIVYFKCNIARLSDYPNIRNYCREFYQLLRPTISMSHIKTHYFTSHQLLNPYAIIPRGPGAVSDFLLPHDRDTKFK